MSDPYDLLRRAKDIIEGHALGGAEKVWLRDYRKLPGAKLPGTKIRMLRNPHRRCEHNEDIVAGLLDQGYLMEVRNMRRGSVFTQVRLSQKGREALRLREDVKP